MRRRWQRICDATWHLIADDRRASHRLCSCCEPSACEGRRGRSAGAGFAAAPNRCQPYKAAGRLVLYKLKSSSAVSALPAPANLVLQRAIRTDGKQFTASCGWRECDGQASRRLRWGEGAPRQPAASGGESSKISSSAQDRLDSNLFHGCATPILARRSRVHARPFARRQRV